MNPFVFELGSFSLRWYTLIIFIAFVVVSYLVFKECKRFNLNKDYVFNLIFWTVIFGFLGARLYYVIFNWSYYSGNLLEIIKVWQGGLAIHGGIIAGVITIIVYTKKYSVNTLKILDICSVPLLLGQAIGRWGNFFNSEAHGSATTLSKLESLHIPEFIIKGMEIDGIYYHPTFFYESIWCLLGFIILLVIRRNKYTKIGSLICLYLMWYSFGRFFIESMRTDSLMFGGFKAAQLLSIVLFAISFIYLVFINKKSKFENLYNEMGRQEINF